MNIPSLPKAGLLLSALILSIPSSNVSAAKTDKRLITGQAVRFDTSPPLREMLKNIEKQTHTSQQNIPAEFEIPNILNIPPSQAEMDFLNAAPQPSAGVNGTNGLDSPMVDISVDGFTAADNIAVIGGAPLPPDTNGDVGIQYYIQYVNLGWKIMNKSDGSVAAGPFIGNSFWDGFGGNCETNNAGDPIVLYDKNVDRWVFSQFTSSGNPDGRQCFAISTTNDPQGPYHRYEFVFTGEFNDYPHIGIWDDESGQRSGYYFVTHDFVDVGGPNQGFNQASYAVVERDAMLTGDPAQFVRFTDTNFFGASSFGAQPAHLESKELPPAGMCNPFVLGRPDQQGYQIVNFCVDWNDVNNSTLSTPFIAAAGESWAPGPGSVAQPNTGQQLDTLASFGRIMYRSSFRAYPADKGLDNTLVFSFPVNVGGGQAGVRWAQLDFPTSTGPGAADLIFENGFDPVLILNPVVVNQGEYAPDGTDRWMPGISVDQDGNIGVAYSAANSDLGIFPGVRFTTRGHNDTPNTLRNEEVCVDGGGSQTSSSGRWGDYSSLSVDPVDECTFWASVEYQPTTANANWSNRVCSFKMANCGEPSFSLDQTVSQTIQLCSATTDEATYDFGLNAFNNFTESVEVSLSGEPVGSIVSYPAGTTFTSFPATGGFLLSGLTGQASAEVDMTLTATSVSITDTLVYRLSISDATTSDPAVLNSPADNSTGVASLPTFEWNTVTAALNYRFELATDANFNNIIVSAVTDALTYTPEQSLAVNTTYFWRVVGLNNCGDGVSSATFQFTTGSFVTGTPAECINGTSPNIVFFDDLEGDVSDWSIPTAPVGTNTWTQSTTQAFAGSAFFAQDVPTSSDQYLVSPPIVLPSIAESPLSLSYWNYQELETDSGSGSNACWDGGLLEISTDGGNNFTQISSAELLGDQYNGAITTNPNSPISGLQAWCASAAVPAAGNQIDISVVNLDNYAGQTVQFRFRLGTDSAVGAEGWYIDNPTVQGCQANN